MKEKLTLGNFRELTKDLPDDTQITECDYDESGLSCSPEQFVLNAQFIMFVSNKCYSQWQDTDFEGIENPIPECWK